jgi:hypothetical protein
VSKIATDSKQTLFFKVPAAFWRWFKQNENMFELTMYFILVSDFS